MLLSLLHTRRGGLEKQCKDENFWKITLMTQGCIMQRETQRCWIVEFNKFKVFFFSWAATVALLE